MGMISTIIIGMEQELIVMPGRHALSERHEDYHLANDYRFVSNCRAVG